MVQEAHPVKQIGLPKGVPSPKNQKKTHLVVHLLSVCACHFQHSVHDGLKQGFNTDIRNWRRAIRINFSSGHLFPARASTHVICRQLSRNQQVVLTWSTQNHASTSKGCISAPISGWDCPYKLTFTCPNQFDEKQCNRNPLGSTMRYPTVWGLGLPICPT